MVAPHAVIFIEVLQMVKIANHIAISNLYLAIATRDSESKVRIIKAN